MANREHLALAMQGGSAWNQWREEHPKATPNLAGAHLSGAELMRAHLVDADLSDAHLWEADLSGADLRGANLRGANLVGADLRGADLRGANTAGADLSGADLRDANLSQLALRGVALQRANLRGANLDRADLSEARLRETRFCQANLRHAKLWGAHVRGADLSKADLRGADLRGADLRGVNLSDAQLDSVQAFHTNFEGATFTGACLAKWTIDSGTNLDDVTCDYIYMQANGSDRRPPQGNFGFGDFAQLFQQAIETLDLAFRDGIDWQSFLVAFEELENELQMRAETAIDARAWQLSVQALEAREDGSFVVRALIPAHCDPAALEVSFKRMYGRAVKANQQIYRKLGLGEEQFEQHRQSSTDLLELVRDRAHRSVSSLPSPPEKDAQPPAADFQSQPSAPRRTPNGTGGNHPPKSVAVPSVERPAKPDDTTLKILVRLQRAIAAEPTLPNESKTDAIEMLQILFDLQKQQPHQGTVRLASKTTMRMLRELAANLAPKAPLSFELQCFLPQLATQLRLAPPSSERTLENSHST